MRKHITLLLFFSCLLINGFSQDLNDYLLRSTASLETGKFNDAIGLSREALKENNDYRLYLVLGEAEYRLGLLDDAQRSYKAANTLSPGSGELGLALVYAAKNMEKEAIASLESHLKSDFKVAESDLVLDKRFLSMQSGPGWKNLWKKTWYTQLERGVSEAIYLLENNRLEELTQLEERLLPLYRGEAAMLYLQALRRAALDDNDAALAFFGQAQAQGYGTREFYKSYIQILQSNNKYMQAREVCKAAIKRYPGSSTYILLLAEANRGLGDRDRAFENVNLYLELFPESEEGLSLAGKIMYENRNYSEALKYYSKSLELYPGNPEHYRNRGDVYSRTKTWQYAIYDYSMALDLQPGDGDVYYMKGKALLMTGKRDDACRDFRMALKYGNKNAAAEINKNCIR